jgi:hypothetical protein
MTFRERFRRPHPLTEPERATTTAHQTEPEPEQGRGIVRAAWAATAILAVTSAAAVASDAAPVRTVAATVSLTLFAAGVAVFFWAYAIAVGRSRSDEIGIGGLFFLLGEGTAPKRTANQLRGALAAQVAVALAAAAARPFTSLAFGVLAPLSALALMGLYGARYGRFGQRSR